jgi:hypothetical protein
MAKACRASWVFFAATVLTVRDARAEDAVPQEKPPLVTVDLGAATAFPVMVAGAQAVVEGPFGFQLRGDLGWLGSPYVKAIDGFLLAVGAYGSGALADATSDLVRAGVRNSLTGRASLGMRPMRERGLEVYAGYTVNALGGSLGGKSSVEAVTGVDFPSDYEALNANIDSTLHSVHVGFGWRWLPVERLVLRASVEYLQTVGSSTRVFLAGPRNDRELPQISGATNAYLDDLYRTWVKTPVVSLSAAYRF